MGLLVARRLKRADRLNSSHPRKPGAPLHRSRQTNLYWTAYIPSHPSNTGSNPEPFHVQVKTSAVRVGYILSQTAQNVPIDGTSLRSDINVNAQQWPCCYRHWRNSLLLLFSTHAQQSNSAFMHPTQFVLSNLLIHNKAAEALIVRVMQVEAMEVGGESSIVSI